MLIELTKNGEQKYDKAGFNLSILQQLKKITYVR